MLPPPQTLFVTCDSASSVASDAFDPSRRALLSLNQATKAGANEAETLSDEQLSCLVSWAEWMLSMDNYDYKQWKKGP